jgi:hypothetical protein
LPGIDRNEPGAYHLGGVGALVDAEAEKRRCERRHHIDRAGLEEAGHAHHRKDKREIEPEQQLQDDRRAAEKPGIADRDAAQHGIVRHAHDGEENAEHDAERHRQDRHDDRVRDAAEDRRHGEEAKDVSPFDLTLREGAADERQDGNDGTRGEPTAEMPTPDDPQPRNIGQRKIGRGVGVLRARCHQRGSIIGGGSESEGSR